MTTATVQLVNALLRIPLDLLDPGPNVRTHLAGIDDLANSIKTLGLQKPLLVTETPAGRYRILDGHRRHAAAKRLGLATVDAVLRREAPDAVRIQQQLAIQSQTAGFDPIAEATALHQLMWVHNLTREQIASAVGHSPTWVRDRISLLQLAEDEKRAVAGGRMSVGEALAILASRRAMRDGRKPTGRPVGARTSARPDQAHCKTCSCGGAR